MDIQLTTNRRFWGTKTIKRTLPEKWADIKNVNTRLKCLRIVALLPKTNAAVQVLQLLLDVPKTLFVNLLDADVLILLNRLDWLFAEPDTSPLIRSFTHRGGDYFLPEKGFSNGIAFEFALADDAYNDWISDPKNNDPLILLVATLCREQKTDARDIEQSGDIRVPIFTEYEAKARAKELQDIDFAVVLAVLRYFQAVKKLIHDSGVALGIFERPRPANPNQEKADDADGLFGWWTTFRNIAKTNVMGNEEQVWRVNFWRMFAFLQEEKKRADDMEREMKKASKNY